MGSFSKVLEGFSSISDILDSDIATIGNEAYYKIRDSLKGLNIDEAKKKLADLKLNPELATEILEAANKSKLLEGSADEIAEGMKNIEKFGSKLEGLENLFKGAADEAGKLLKTLLTSPTTWLIAIPALAIALEDLFTVDYGEANEAFQKSAEAYNETKKNVESLNSELKTTKDRITELENLDKLSLAEKAELEELQSQNAELERKIALEQKLLEIQSAAASRDAKEAMSKGSHSVAQSVKFGDSTGESEFKGEVGKVTDAEAIKENIALIKEYENELPNLQKQVNDAKANLANSEGLWEIFDKQAVKDAESELKDYEDSITTLYKDLDVRASNIKSQLDILELNPEENAEEIRILKEALNSINNIELTGIRKEFASLESFFDGSSGRNAIKEKLLDSSSSTKELEKELSRLGLTLDDIGIGNIGFLYDYLKDIKEAAKEATDSVQDYSSTVSDIEVAGESADQDKNWSTVSEAYKEAKELLKEGKTGTDNFQTMASFLNPAKVKELAEEGGKYTADAYQKAFEEVKKTANRWFGEDETKSMENFVNDFKKKGLFDVETDEMGLWDIETNFKTTAEAADEFGISIEAVETMLEALGAYGYEFEGITFSGDALSEYESYLSNIRTMYDELEESDLKNRLSQVIEDADLADFENNIENLTPEIIADIKFEYDLAQIDQEIQKLRDAASGEGFTNTTSNAGLMASNESRSSKWREENSKAKKDSGYVGLDKTIDSLEDSMVGKSGDELSSIQRQIIAVQELRMAFENAYDAAEADGKELNWDDYINSTEANDALASISEKLGVTEDELEGILGKDFTLSITSNVNMNNVRHLREEIENLQRNSSITFEASVDGVDTVIEAVRDVRGNVKYYADVDGVTTELAAVENIDGTVYYVPVTDLVDKHDYDQDGVVDYKGIFPTSAPNLTATVKYSYSYAHDGSLPSENLNRPRVSGTFLSPAHKDGTAYNVLNTLPLSAYAGGHVGLPRNERALVNEEYINGHSESIVRDGVWRLIPGGAHLENLKQGDLIFSAQQTEDLLRSGRTPGHARAFAQGNVLASAYRLGNNTGGSSGKNSKDNKTSTENQPEKFDWIERKIQKVQRAIEKLDKIANSTYKTWTARNEALSKEISKVNDEIDIQEKAYREYIKEANSVGLEKKYRDLVRYGKIDIQTIKNDKLKEKIQEYQEWIDKARDCKDAIAELEETEASLYQQRFDNVASKYDSILERYDYRQSMHEELIAQNEAKGQIVSGRYYQSMIYAEEDRLEQLKKEREELYDAFEKGMDAKGNPIKRGSEAWREMLNTINETTVEIEKSETAILEFEKTIRELDWANFDLLQERISNVTAESDFLIKVMSDEKMHDEKGNLTDEGLATMGLHAQNYETYLLQAEIYAKEIARLDKDIAKNPYNQDLINRRQELLGLQRDSILASEDEKAAIVDMVQSGIDLEIEALQDVIDKQKERLDSAKDLYDYQKKINNLAKEHSSIQKQILAHSGDDSEENRARLQQLQVKLEESQENLRDAEYEKYLSDHKELLDSLQTEYTDVLNERMDNIDALFSEMLDKVDTNRSDILKTLIEQASGVGTTISDSISDVWINGKTVICGLQTTVDTISVDLKNTLDSLLSDARTDAQQVSDENAFNSDEANINATNISFVQIEDKNGKDEPIISFVQVDDKKGKVDSVSSKAEANNFLSDLNIKKIKKLNSYATGSKYIDEDQLAWLNENGNVESIIRQRDGAILRPLAEGDRVLNAATTEKLYNLALDPTKYFADNIGMDKFLSSVPFVRNSGDNINNVNVDLTINAPNVTDTETLIYEIKHNKEIERTFLAMTTDRMMGKSHLRKY